MTNMYAFDASAEAITEGITVCSLTDDDGLPLDLEDMREPLKVNVDPFTFPSDVISE